MRLKHSIPDHRLILIIAAAFLCLVAAAPVMAQEDPDPEPQEETSYFNNAAQAAKAENLAAISAEMAAGDEEAQEALGIAEGDLEAAQMTVDDAEALLDAFVESYNSGLPAEDQITREDVLENPDDFPDLTDDERMAADSYDQYQSDLSAAQSAFDQALANATGVSVAEIAGLRASGMGWGEIAHELGIHPSALGLGNKYGHQNQIQNQNRNRNKEMASYGYGKKAGAMSSTTRDLKTGGNAYGKSKSNQGQGKGADKAGGLGQANGQGKGVGNQAGGKSNNGNSGNGNNGNGKGNNKD